MIPVSRPSITELEKKYVNEAMNEGMISTGKFVPLFENAWRRFNDYSYAVACSSGTAAMFLALKALGIGPGDEVIVPEFTMASTAWAVSYTGATPVFIDCADDLNLDINKLIRVVTPRTKAIMPVHVYGRRCHMELIKVFADRYKLKIVEDMAEAHGIIPTGDIACYSFQGNKIITCGEGGMCLTNDRRTANEIRLLSTLYFDKHRTLFHEKMGYNFKMTNLQAAIGYAQIKRFPEILTKRKFIEKWYNENLPYEFRMPNRNVLWMYDVKVGKFQNEIKKELEKRGVETRFFFKPMSMQPMYGGHYYNLRAFAWSKTGLYLPTFTDMKEDDVKYVCKTLIDIHRELNSGII